MHLLTALQDQASDVLLGDPKGVMYEENVGALEDRFGDQHLVTGYGNQQKRGTQILGESLQELATTIE
jgi:hypothetical protein